MAEHDSTAELRKAADAAEKDRLAAADAGVIAAPGTGDYNAALLAAKQSPMRSEDPAADAVPFAREKAAQARRAAGAVQSPQGRRTRSEVMQGGGTAAPAAPATQAPDKAAENPPATPEAAADNKPAGSDKPADNKPADNKPAGRTGARGPRA